MLMEYLGPVVDGCRAALNISIDKAQELSKMSEDDFDQHISSVTDSYRDITFCIKASDIDEEYSVVFDKGKTSVFDECVEPDVVMSSENDILVALFNSDPKLSPPEVLGNKLHISGNDSMDVVEGLGFLCYPSLLRVAKSVVKMIRKWIDTQLTISEV
jgi:hypothetical protein